MADERPEAMMNDDRRAISVLLVEDSATQAEMLKAMLENRGLAVALAANGEEGLSSARAHPPDVVVSDIVMPILDGYGLCRRIKSDARLKDTPVILLTSLSDPADVIRGLESGADGFIIKIGLEDIVLDAIERQLARRDRGDSTGNPVAVWVRLEGRECRIQAWPQRICDFLISTYEVAFRNNAALVKARDELGALNVELERKVRNRTEEIARKNLEMAALSQQFLQAGKLATMGELTASIAHELNNPLQTVSLHIESLLARLVGDSPALSALSVVQAELDRMAKMVSNLLQLSRRAERRVSPVSVSEELEKTLEFIQDNLRKRGIEVRREYQPDVPRIQADPEQLRQVFLNLFTNAIDAMPSGGTLILRALYEGALTLEIADTGTGIEAADLPRVMESFYTTKPPGMGTGLGLPICRRIVEAHGGQMTIESEPGHGTTVRIVLPPGTQEEPSDEQ